MSKNGVLSVRPIRSSSRGSWTTRTRKYNRSREEVSQCDRDVAAQCLGQHVECSRGSRTSTMESSATSLPLGRAPISALLSRMSMRLLRSREPLSELGPERGSKRGDASALAQGASLVLDTVEPVIAVEADPKTPGWEMPLLTSTPRADHSAAKGQSGCQIRRGCKLLIEGP